MINKSPPPPPPQSKQLFTPLNCTFANVKRLVVCYLQADIPQECVYTPMEKRACNHLFLWAVRSTVFPRSDAAATINFPLLALAATIRGRRLLEGGVNYTLHDSLLFSSINFDCHVQKYYFW